MSLTGLKSRCRLGWCHRVAPERVCFSDVPALSGACILWPVVPSPVFQTLLSGSSHTEASLHP